MGFIEKKKIFHPVLSTLVVIGMVEITIACLLEYFYWKKEANISAISVSNMEVTILFAVIATLSIVTSVINNRYLGADYKYWIFKEKIYCILPQDWLLIMCFATVTTFYSEIFLYNNRFGTGLIWIALVLFVIGSVCIMYRVYVMVIKVSRVFVILDKKICGGKRSDRLTWCDKIYTKLTAMSVEDDTTHNSYLMEELGIILHIMDTYKTLNDEDKDKKCEKLLRIIVGKVKREIRVIKKNKESYGKHLVSDAKHELYEKIIKKGNEEYIENQYSMRDTFSIDDVKQAVRTWVG